MVPSLLLLFYLSTITCCLFPCVPEYLQYHTVCLSLSASVFLSPPLSHIHSLCQLLANPSSNPVKERYAVSSYLG